jgi:enterochelin esterase-like enzyme
MVHSRRARLSAAAILLAVLVAATREAGSPAGSFATRTLVERIESLPPDRRESAIETLVRDRGTPLVDRDGALFLVQAAEDRTPRIVGDFNGWPDVSQGGEGGRMRPVPGTRWFALGVRLHAAARIEYLVHWGGTSLDTDPGNPRVVAGIDRSYSELRMSGYVEPDAFKQRWPEPRGAVTTFRIGSGATTGMPFGDREREGATGRDAAPSLLTDRRTGRVHSPEGRVVHVYTPPGYERSTARYPVVYFGDGSHWVKLGEAPRILDVAIAAGRIRPVIAVFADPRDRHAEYSGSRDYRRQVIAELIPWVESRYRVETGRAGRAIVGSSRGGLMAVDLALAHPDAFAWCGALSPATQPIDVSALARTARRGDVRFVITGAAYDARWVGDARRLHEVLIAHGFSSRYVESPEGHSYGTWRAQLDAMLRRFFPLI